MKFEWDEAKNQINQKKHGISFEEARDVFVDVYAILFDDPDHSEEEDRFLIIGMTSPQEKRQRRNALYMMKSMEVKRYERRI